MFKTDYLNLIMSLCIILLVHSSALVFAQNSAATPALDNSCYCKKWDSQDPCFKANFKDEGDWKKKRTRMEIIIYDGTNPDAPSFVKSASNVTREDTVFLLINNSNPLLYTYTPTIESKKAPERALLNVLGTISIGNPFKMAETNAPATGEDTKKVVPPAEATKGVTTQGVGEKTFPEVLADAADRGILSQEDVAKFNKTEGDLVQALPSCQSAGQDWPKLREEILDTAYDIKELEAEFAKFQLSPGETKTKWEFNVKSLEDSRGEKSSAIKGLIKKVDVMMECPANAKSLYHSVKTSFETFRDKIQKSKLAKDANTIKAIRSEEKAIAEYAADVDSLLTFGNMLSNVEADLKTFQGALASLRTALDTARVASRNLEQCIGLGKFEEGDLVTITMTAKKQNVNAPATEVVSEKKSVVVEGDSLEMNSDKDKKVEVSGNISTIHFGNAGKSAPQTAPADQDPPDQSADKSAKKDSKTTDGNADQATKVISVSQTSFEVLKPYHARVSLGFAVSLLKDPTFDFRKTSDIPADETKKTPAQKELVIFRSADDRVQLKPVASLSLYLKPQYLFAEDDPSDPYESVSTTRRYVPYPTLGFSFTDPTENYYVGGGIDIARGVALLMGVHLGKVSRLIHGFEEDKPFIVAADEEFKVANVVEKSYRAGFYFSLTMDSGTLLSIFGGNDTGSKAK